MAVIPCTCNLCTPRTELPDQATLDAVWLGLGETPEAKLLAMPTRFVPRQPLPFRATYTPIRYQWPAWMFHHDRGIGYFRFHGWGVQWRDTRRNPPTYDTRAQWTKIGIGPYLLRLLRP